MSAPEDRAEDRRTGGSRAGAWAALLLPLLAILFLYPYVFRGRIMLPLEILALCQPWTRHIGDLWGSVPSTHNPLLDTLQQYYPRRVYMQEALQGGWLPLWNPYAYGGSPFLATQQGAVLYPPAWALALLRPDLQFGWSAVFHLSVAGMGAYAFFRQLRLRPAGALAGAVAFAFNGFVVVWLAYVNVTQWTLCWLPLALYCWERGRAEDDLRWIAASAGVLALNVLGGHGQISTYVLLVWGAWALFRTLVSETPARGLLRWVALPAALAICLALGHLLPSMDYVPRTDRGARLPWERVLSYSMPASQLWTFLVPRLFGDQTWDYRFTFWMPNTGATAAFVERTFYPGAAVLVLAGAAFAARRARREERQLAAFSLALAVAGLLLAMATPLYWVFWRFVPGFGQFSAMARVICVSAWGLACLAALGVHCAESEDATVRGLARRALAAGGALGVLAVLCAYYIYGVAPDVVLTLMRDLRHDIGPLATRGYLLALAWIAAPVALVFLAERLGRGRRAQQAPGIAAWGMAAVVAADLFAFGVHYNPAADAALRPPPTPETSFIQAQTGLFRFLSTGPRGQETVQRMRMPSNLPSVFGFADLSGSDSFISRRYQGWEAATGQASGGSPWGTPGAPNLRAAGVRYYLTGASEPFAGLSPVVGTAVQEDGGALPYARLHTYTQVLETDADLLTALAVPNRFPAVALTAGPGAREFRGAPSVTPFEARRVNGNRLLLEGEAPGPGLLVVCEQYEPGWKARVDGRPVGLAPAEHLFLGLPLEAGRHRVELTYAPDAYRVGLFGSLAALACLCGIFAGFRRR